MKIPVAPHFSEEGVHEHGQTIVCGKHDIREGKSEFGLSCRLRKYAFAMLTLECNIDLEIALNYGQAIGAAPLLRFVTEHTEVCPLLYGIRGRHLMGFR